MEENKKRVGVIPDYLTLKKILGFVEGSCRGLSCEDCLYKNGDSDKPCGVVAIHNYILQIVEER